MSGRNFELDVLIIVSSDPRYDTRSTKFLKSLTENGYSARLVGICSDGTPGDSNEITRLPVTARSGKSFFIQFYERVVPHALKTNARLVIAGDLFSLPPAILNKLRHSRKPAPVQLIYDSKELYSELPSLKQKRSSFFFWNLVEKSSIRYVNQALTVNHSIADILSARWGLPFTVVMNVPDRISSPHLSSPLPQDAITLAFSGGLQPGRGLPALVRLLTVLPDKYRLKIVGNGALREELVQLAASLRVTERIQITGRVPAERVISELSDAHLGIYLMENAGLCHYLALPNKFFQFISARLPVIVPKFPEMEKIVNRYDIGAAVDPSDLQSTASTIMKITADPKRYAELRSNCEKAAEDLNWDVEKKNFLEAVGRLIQ